MAWEVLDHAKFTGPAFPTPYVRVDLEKELNKRKLLPKTTGKEGEDLQNSWDSYRRKLRNLVSQGGTVRICNHVFEPLVERLGFKSIEQAEEVSTREGLESGGHFMYLVNGGPGLRVWTTEMDDDLDAPARRGRAYRFSPVRIAQRVLLATGERLGLISNGSELRILICDPARPDSQIEIPVDPYWKKQRKVPDTYRMLLALASPAGIEAIPELVDKARLQQSTVTKELRIQARQAVVRFIQSILDHPENNTWLKRVLSGGSAESGEKAEGGRGKTGGNDDQKSQGFGNLAKSYGFGGGSVQNHQESSQGGKIRFDGADSQGGDIGSFKHCGGTWPKRKTGIPSLPLDSPRITDGTGNSNNDKSTAGISSIEGSRTDTHLNKKLIQHDESAHSQAEETLNSPASRLPPPALMTIDELAKQLWREGLVIIYRLLFILKLEASDDPARAFSFASTSLWRNTFSPSVALAPYARKILDQGEETRNLLEDGIRNMFRMFSSGLECTELNVKPLGGALFGETSTPILSGMRWGEHAVAHLLDRLLWTPRKRGSEARERVHYGPLDVEDLGRVYEALLELEPGYSTETMCRLRRRKLEVVVPVEQGEKYRPKSAEGVRRKREGTDHKENNVSDEIENEMDDFDDGGNSTSASRLPSSASKTTVEWIEEIPSGKFYLRVGLGRKASGSYYTPHSFVRFLVQETLGPQVEERSPKEDPNPGEILKLKVLDPAMGSGHFLVEACRFLGEKLYEACRLCDEYAVEAERSAEEGRRKGEETDTSASRLPSSASKWRQRVIDLPGPEDEIVKYLPSRAPEGEESGLSQVKAEALCRRMVAVHCLYGVDKNPLAVELAKLTLWIETHSEGMPLTFMDHRLVVGDSLTGPFWDKLIFKPGKPDEPIQNLFHKDLDKKFTKALSEALKYARDLESSVGASVSEIDHKRHTKEELDRMMLPFRIAAAAWSGGVMLGPEKCDDEAYSRLMQHITDTGELPDKIDSKLLRSMVARGLGVEVIPAEGEKIESLIQSRQCVSALSHDLEFPEVFYPTGVPHGRRGFNAVLGNPPWDTIRKNEDHFFGMRDFAYLDPPTKREKQNIRNRLLESSNVLCEFESYVQELQIRDRINDTLYDTHKFKVRGQLAGRGTYDDYMLFAELATWLIDNSGLIGFVLPSAFHANEGATGTRLLYFEKLFPKCCYSFENRKKLFEIHRSFKFALVVVGRIKNKDYFPCAFYLHDDDWLFGDRSAHEALNFDLDFIKRTGGDYLSLLELKSPKDLEVTDQCFRSGLTFGETCENLGLKFSQELNMTYDSWRFTLTEEVLNQTEDPRDPETAKKLTEMGYLILHEGKTFWHYDDHWQNRTRFLVAIEKLKDKADWLKASKYYRVAFRDIASSTNERTAIFCLCPPHTIFGNKAPCDRIPSEHSLSESLYFISITNSYVFDFLIRQRVQTSLNFFIVRAMPFPRKDETKLFLTHQSLRLTCNHSGYQMLWSNQLRNEWRESDPPKWPVVESIDDHWRIRASIDAVVANSYGLNRGQYKHVLSTFSHASYPKAPALCLTKFDELKSVGLEAFMQKYDPYWDIPLNEDLPQPDPVVAAAIEKYLLEAEGKSIQKNLFG